MANHIRAKYTAVIGLEVHAQLSLQRKLFSPEAAVYGALPNTQMSLVTLAHPGTLPRLNRQAVAYAIKMGLACHAKITRENFFARKNKTFLSNSFFGTLSHGKNHPRFLEL